jgi:hypothetical protein
MAATEGRLRLTRRQLIKGAGSAVGAVTLGGGVYGVTRPGGRAARSVPVTAPRVGTPMRSFRSRPDLRPASVEVAGTSAEPGYLFLGPGSSHGAQAGPLVVDDAGEPVWFRALPSNLWLTNFAVGSYGGQPVLAWWEGVLVVPVGYGQGEGVLLDSSYRERQRVRAANGRLIDMHEFQITPEGTALFTCFPETRPADLSEVGGPRQGRLLESAIQEVDLRTGRLLMEWRSLEHIPISESYRTLEDPYDYLHVNSIDIAPDGNLLVSARHAWAVYKLHRRTGEVIWRLGGKRSDFAIGEGAQFRWQHDARQVDERTITVFDNRVYAPTKADTQSRAIVLDVDTARRTVRLRHAYTHPNRLQAVAMGSVEILANGNLLVGWGSQPYLSEFAPDGTIVADAAMAAGQQSYRASRVPWKGTPLDKPAIAASRDPRTGSKTLYASWNGATEATHWQVHAGATVSDVAPRALAELSGFETAIPLAAEHRYAAVTALDPSARRLATSRTIKL